MQDKKKNHRSKNVREAKERKNTRENAYIYILIKLLKFKDKENLGDNKGKRNGTYRETTIKLQLNCLKKTIKPEDNGKSILNGCNKHIYTKQKNLKTKNMSPRILSFKISFNKEEIVTFHSDKS